MQQQRQLRLGDILDDYCPRERRVTNHAIVAMIGSDVKQTRCTTCDTEHEYKGAKVPAQRKKKEAPSALYNQVLAGATKGSAAAAEPPVEEPAVPSGRLLASDPLVVSEAPAPVDAAPEPAAEVLPERGEGEEEGPVHRPLIRATLPRTDATIPTRQIPEFTIRQNDGRPGKFRGGSPHRHRPIGAGGHSGGGVRHAGRPGTPGGRGGNRSSSQQRPAHQPHGSHAARPGKKRSR